MSHLWRNNLSTSITGSNFVKFSLCFPGGGKSTRWPPTKEIWCKFLSCVHVTHRHQKPYIKLIYVNEAPGLCWQTANILLHLWWQRSKCLQIYFNTEHKSVPPFWLEASKPNVSLFGSICVVYSGNLQGFGGISVCITVFLSELILIYSHHAKVLFWGPCWSTLRYLFLRVYHQTYSDCG